MPDEYEERDAWDRRRLALDDSDLGDVRREYWEFVRRVTGREEPRTQQDEDNALLVGAMCAGVPVAIIPFKGNDIEFPPILGTVVVDGVGYVVQIPNDAVQYTDTLRAALRRALGEEK